MCSPSSGDRFVGRTVGHLDRIAHREMLAARRVIDFDDGAGLAQRRFLGDLLHGENRSARDVVLVEDVHRLELGLRLRPLLDRAEDPSDAAAAPSGWHARIGQPLLVADHFADRLPSWRLGDEIDVALGSVSQPLHLRIHPGCPPPEAFPARGTASPNVPLGYCGYSSRSFVRSSRC